MSMIDSVYASNIMTHIFHFVFASVNEFSKYYKTLLCKSVFNLSFFKHGLLTTPDLAGCSSKYFWFLMHLTT